MEELLLKSEEVAEIIKIGSLPFLRNPNMLGPGVGRLHRSAVWKVSKKGLILIKGDEHTGFEHINSRHNYHVAEPSWKQNQDKKGQTKYSVDNPSKFRRNSLPVVEYCVVSDAIYDPTNLSKENKRPDIFDVYDGVYSHEGGEQVRYRLVLYKDTPIIHTFFPRDKTFTREKVVNYVKGTVHSVLRNHRPITIFVPYEDHEQKLRYNLVIHKYLQEKREEAFIEAFNDEGKIFHKERIGERFYEEFRNLNTEMMWWQMRDLAKEEKLIRDMDNRLKSA